MRSAAIILATIAMFLSACAGTPATPAAPTHQVTPAEIVGKTLTFSAKDRFQIAPVADGSMSYSGWGKSGTGEWRIEEGKFWVKSGDFWRRGSNWTFYGPNADGTFTAINARDSLHTHYRVTIQ